MTDRTLRKAGRLSRLLPARVAAFPPTPRPLVIAKSTKPLPPRALTAHDLIAVARQARVTAEIGTPPQASGVP